MIPSTVLLRAGAFCGALVAITTTGNYLVAAAPWQRVADAESQNQALNKHIDDALARIGKLQTQADQTTMVLTQMQRAYWVGQREDAEMELAKHPNSPSAQHLLDLSEGQIADADRSLQKGHSQ